MKTIDFTQLGGFPLTQNALAHMQAAYTEIAAALVTTATPVVLSGLISSTVGTNIEYTQGYIAYQGEVIKVAAGFHHVSAVASAQIKLVALSTTLIYDNGSSHASKTDRVGEIVQDGSGTFLISLLQPFLVVKSAEQRTGWINILNDATGKLDYRFDKVAQLVSVRGWVKHVQAISTSTQTGAHGIGSFSLPSECRPTNVAVGWGLQFPTTLQKGSGAYIDVIKDINGSVYDSGIVGVMSNGGMLLVTRKLDTGVTLPNHIINFTYAV